MANTEIITKENELFGKVRFVKLDNKEYAVGKDVATALGYKDASSAISKHCKNGIKTMLEAPCQNGNMVKTQTTLIPEGDIYRLIIKSKLPQAEKFESWVMDEVLPQIRQTGGYIPIDENMSDMEILSRAVLISQKTIENKNKIIENQKKQLEEQKPMVDFANTIASSSDSIDMGTFAKLVKDEDVFVGGRNKLFEHLRSKGYLMKNNVPYQRYIDNGVFELVEYTYKTPYGERLGSKCLVSGKGQVYLIEKLRKENK